jgi:hypothetical protein
MGFCTACGHPRSGTKRYCTGCGASLPETTSIPEATGTAGATGSRGETGSRGATGSPGLESEQTIAAPVRQSPVRPTDPPGGAAPIGTARQAGSSGQPAQWPSRDGQRVQGPGHETIGPAEYGQRPGPARRSRVMVAAVSVTAVVAIAAAVVIAISLTGSHGPTGLSATSPALSSTPTTAATPTPTPTPSPSPSSATPSPSATSALTEATAISNLLSAGVASRSALVTAVNDVMQCTSLSGAVSQIQQSADARQTELNAAQGLSTGALPNDATLKSYLVQALQHSLDADDEYLTWAQQEAASCQFGSQPNIPDNQGSSKYKTLFVGIWNPIASQYGLPTASANTM